jgi:hypothetical protein
MAVRHPRVVVSISHAPAWTVRTMLPKAVETLRLKELKAVVDAATAAELVKWPQPNEKDVVLVGAIVVLYSYIDLDLRRIAEAAEVGGRLKEPWKGKTAKLTIADIESAVLSLPDWSEPNLLALAQIKEFRGLRNLMAHFAIRRFPKDDAFLFLTKSARDFKREFGIDPEPGTAMTAVVECQATRDAVLEIEKLHTWLAQATPQIEARFGFVDPP